MAYSIWHTLKRCSRRVRAVPGWPSPGVLAMDLQKLLRDLEEQIDARSRFESHKG